MMADREGLQLAIQINGLALLTPEISHIVSSCVFGKSANPFSGAEKGKAAATAIANGFGIHTHNVYSLSDSSLQEVAG